MRESHSNWNLNLKHQRTGFRFVFSSCLSALVFCVVACYFERSRPPAAAATAAADDADDGDDDDDDDNDNDDDDGNNDDD